MLLRIRFFLLLGGCALLYPTLTRGGDWPQFRGPNGSGIVEDKSLPTEWSADKNVKWKVVVPGVGWSSPIVVGDKVFVTTAVSEKQNKPRAGGGFGGGGGGGKGGGGFGKGGTPPNALYRFELHCLDASTGNTIWKKAALEAKPKIATHSTNTYATETPVTDGKHIYAYFGMHGLFCYDLAGEQVWKKDIGTFPMQFGWGTASSPVLDGDRLFIQCDNEEKSFIIALDKKTGNELWRVARSERSTWCTPLVWKNKTRTEIVAIGSTVRSYSPEDGKLLWELKLGGGQCSVSPVADKETLFVGSGSGGGGGMGKGGGGGGGGMGGGGGTLFAVKAGATGNITPKSGETSSEGVLWAQPKSGLGMSSPLIYQGHVYVLERNGGLISCYDAKTGKPTYSKERITGARAFWASPWAHDGKVYCLDEEGNTFVVQAGSEFKLLGKNTLKEMFWSTPSAAGESILLRGVDYLYCVKQ